MSFLPKIFNLFNLNDNSVNDFGATGLNKDNLNKNINNVNSEINEIKSKIKIIGFGNLFMGDDGVGVKIINILKEQNIFNEQVEIIDGGTSGVDLIFLLKDAQKVIIIDAVDAGQKIGEIVVFEPENIKEFLKKKTSFKSFSLHDIDLVEVFDLLKTLGLKTEIKIIGIKPKKVGYSDKLSPEIETQIPEIIAQIKKEVKYLTNSG